MSQNVESILAAAQFYTDGQDYILAKLPPAAITAAAGVVAEVGEPFCALIVDKDEVTLLLPAEAWEDFKRRLPGHVIGESGYRLITIDIELAPDLVGFMAFISAGLAAAGVTILPLAAFSRDHLFVQAGQFELALSTLKKLQSGSKS